MCCVFHERLGKVEAPTCPLTQPLKKGATESSVASDRYAVLDDGKSFSLVPWRSVIEHRVGQEMSAMVNGRTATW